MSTRLSARRPSAKTVRTGFTLIELLVVISIISLLISILLPALAKARAKGRTVLCMNHLKQLGIAEAIYNNEENSWYTPGWQYADLLNDSIRVSPAYLQQGPGRTYKHGEKGYPFKCPEVQGTYGVAINTGGSLREITCLDYTRNSGLHGTQIASATTSNASLRWRRESDLNHSPSKVLNMADGRGSGRLDYSQFGMSLRHDDNRTINLLYADGHGINWRPQTATATYMSWTGSTTIYRWY